MTVDIAENSATGQKKFTARQWLALIGFSGVETRKQIQNIWKQIRKDCDATEVRTIVVTAIKEQKIDVDRQSSSVWYGNNVAEEIYKFRFTYIPMENIAKTERGVLIVVFVHCTAQEIWDM